MYASNCSCLDLTPLWLSCGTSPHWLWSNLFSSNNKISMLENEGHFIVMWEICDFCGYSHFRVVSVRLISLVRSIPVKHIVQQLIIAVRETNVIKMQQTANERYTKSETTSIPTLSYSSPPPPPSRGFPKSGIKALYPSVVYNSVSELTDSLNCLNNRSWN